MEEDSTAFDSKTMESIVVEDASLNQSEVSFKPNSSRDPGCRPTPVMVPVVFEKENVEAEQTSDKNEGTLDTSNPRLFSTTQEVT